MLDEIHFGLIAVHIGAGTVALIAFWFAMLARKGNARHRAGGRWFAWAMRIVTVTAVIAALLVLADPLAIEDPAGALATQGAEAMAEVAWRARRGALFLLTIGLLVLASVRHGMLALRTRSEPDALRSPQQLILLTALCLAGLATAYVGWRAGSILLMVFGGLALVSGPRMLHRALSGPLPAQERIIAHLEGMLGASIGAYTAFFVFGGNRFLSEWLDGYWALIPWIAPAVLGSIASGWYARRYRRRASGARAASATAAVA
ncbi:MAG: hypothetical protein AAGA68_23520 [Pseudomonadota bacterium]